MFFNMETHIDASAADGFCKIVTNENIFMMNSFFFRQFFIYLLHKENMLIGNNFSLWQNVFSSIQVLYFQLQIYSIFDFTFANVVR